MAQSDTTKSGTYQFGHHPAVTKIHAQRTILDVGCGPGSITLDFASLVPEGSVLGIDFSPEAIPLARTAATGRDVQNCEFEIGDVMRLDFEDGEFDVVHCHQCLLHLPDPVESLKEMNRVCKSGGMVAVGEADLGNMIVYPEDSGLLSGIKLLGDLVRVGGSEPRAGRRLKAWALEADFTKGKIEISGHVEVYSTAEETSLIGGLYAGRFDTAAMGGKDIELGLISEEERVNIVDAWMKWSRRDDAFFSITHIGLLYHK